MAKSGKGRKPKQAPKSQGPPKAEVKGAPVCIASLYCDSAIVGEDKMVTIIRTIDSITFSAGTQLEIGQLVELPGPTRLVLMLKRDDAIGRHELPVTLTSPTGDTDVIGMLVVDFSEGTGPDVGYNFVGPVHFVWRGDGLYWLQVTSKRNKLIARTSLRLNVAKPQDKK